jgi:shikimate kinase
MSIILCGPPLSGKSYFGKRISERLGWTFIETDQLIEERYCSFSSAQLSPTGLISSIEKEFIPILKLSCREIYKKHGNSFFRQIEQQATEQLASMPPAKRIIATGGGTLELDQNVRNLKQIGRLLYLKTDRALLLTRLKSLQELPAYLDPSRLKQSYEQSYEQSYLELVEKRSAQFERHADIIVPIQQQSEEELMQLFCQLCNQEI